MMDRAKEIWRRAFFLLRRGRFDHEMRDEIQFHIDMKTEENIAAGMAPDEARYDALRRFGNRTRAQEEAREVWLFLQFERLRQDLRYGFRMLRRDPLFNGVALLALALGIGANTAIFSVVNSVLLRPLPFHQPDRLVVLDGAPLSWHFKPNFSDDDFLDWRGRLASYQQIAAWNHEESGVNLTGGAEPERVRTREVTVNFFDTLGVRPALGRGFVEEESAPGRTHVVILGARLWRRQFGADANIVGQSVTLNHKSFTVVGIAPEEFDYPDGAELWIPLSFRDDRVTNSQSIGPRIIARMRDGVTLQQTAAEMEVFSANYAEENAGPDSLVREGRPIVATPLIDQTVKNIRPALLIVFGAVGLVLLIACANVANLLLARSEFRHKEFAVRAALGAGRLRLIRQLLIESLLLAFLGGGLGLLLAVWGVNLLVRFRPADLPRAGEIDIDPTVLAFTLAVSLLTGVLFGLLPAIKGSKLDLNEALKEGGKSSASRGQRRMGNALVVSEVALTLVLLLGAGLLIKSFQRLMQVDPGFTPENLLTVSVSLPALKYATPAQKAEFFAQLTGRLGTLPGVQAAAAADVLPLGRTSLLSIPFKLDGDTDLRMGPDSRLATAVITPDYFTTLKMPLLAGRTFTEGDSRQAPPVLIINETMARRLWPGQDPIGKQVTLLIDRKPKEVVGIVGDTRQMGLEGELMMEAYVPYQQSRFALNQVVVRTASDPRQLAGAVRSEVHALDPNLPLYNVKTMEEQLSGSVAKRRFMLVLLAAFASLALLLALIGVYGMLSYSVRRRTHEIGIRMALGAKKRDVIRLVLRQALALLLCGVALGLVLAFVATRSMESLLYGVSATDPVTFVVIPAILVGVALLASAIPAYHAAKVDPLVALHYE